MIQITKQEMSELTKLVHKRNKEYKHKSDYKHKHTYSNKKQIHKQKSMSCVPNNKSINYLPKDIQKLQKDAQSTMTNINKLHNHGWITDVQVARCRNLMNYNLAKHYVNNKDKAFIPSPKVKHQQLNDTMKAMNAHMPKDTDYALSNQVVTMINGGATYINANPNEMASPTQSNRYIKQVIKHQKFNQKHPVTHKIINYSQKQYHQHIKPYVNNGMQHVNTFTDKVFDKIITSQHNFTQRADDYGKKVKTIDIKSKFNHLVHGMKSGIHGFKNNFNKSASSELHRKFNVHKTRTNPTHNQEPNHHMSRMQRLHHRQGFNR